MNAYEVFSYVAEAVKPKLYNWSNSNDASDDWVSHGLRLATKWSALDCNTVSSRHVQMPLLLPIPAEPVHPVDIAAAAPSATLAA